MMKLLNKKQKCNGGFSLVELIVVIAIMVVLIAVLAPVFTKYIESSRRSTDVQNAAQIKTAVETNAIDQKAAGQTPTAGPADATKANIPPLNDDIKIKGNKVEASKGKSFVFTYDANSGKCTVYVPDDAAQHDLTSDAGAEWYKSND